MSQSAPAWRTYKDPERDIFYMEFRCDDGSIRRFSITKEMLRDQSNLFRVLGEISMRHGIEVNWAEVAKDMLEHGESPARKAWKTRLENKRKKMQSDGLIPRTVEEDVHDAVKDAVRMLKKG
jgi:hypothetical protein